MWILTQMSWVFFATGKGQRGEKDSARRAGGQQPYFKHSGLPMDAPCRGAGEGGERLTFPEHLCPPPPSIPFSWEGLQPPTTSVTLGELLPLCAPQPLPLSQGKADGTHLLRMLRGKKKKAVCALLLFP